MTIEQHATTMCPHCGGEIRAAAKVCKHCKRALPEAKEIGHESAGAPSARWAIRGDLRTFLLARQVALPHTLDASLANEPTGDVVASLRHLASVGLITPMQVEALQQGFQAQQEARVGDALHGAVGRGLLTDQQARDASSTYRSVLFERSPREFLVGGQYLTVTQADSLLSAGAPAGGGASFASSMPLAAASPASSWDRALERTRNLCDGFVGELRGSKVRRTALWAGALLLATILVPRGFNDDGLLTAFDLERLYPRTWITTTFPAFAGILLLIAGALSRKPNGWLTAVCAITGFVPALVAMEMYDLDTGLWRLCGSLGPLAALVAVALCVEALRRRDSRPTLLARGLFIGSTIVLALGAFATFAGGFTSRSSLILVSLLLTVEKATWLAAGWLAAQTARGERPSPFLCWALLVGTLGTVLLMEPLNILSAIFDGDFTIPLLLNGVVLFVLKTVELLAGVAAVGYLVFGDSWKGNPTALAQPFPDQVSTGVSP